MKPLKLSLSQKALLAIVIVLLPILITLVALQPVSSMGWRALTALMAALPVALLFFFFHREVVLPLRVIARAAAGMAKSGYATRIPAGTDDEIGDIARAFNDMSMRIRELCASLSGSEQRLRSILNNYPAVAYLKDLDGRYLFVNGRFERLFRTSSEEAAGKTDFDILPAEAAGALLESDIRVIEGGSTLESEKNIPQEDGVHTYISVKFPLLNETGKPSALCGFLTDITERKRMETALRENEARLKKAQELAKTGSWEWDVPNNALWWSDEIYRIFGLKPGEFAATYESFLKSVHPDDRESVERSVKNAFYDKRPYSIDHRIVLPDGAEKTVHEEAEVFADETGRPVKMIGTVQDLTEQRRAERELKKLSAIIEHSVNLVFITDRTGAIQYVNPTFEQVTGFSKEDAIGQTPRILASGEVPNAKYQELWSTILSGRTWRSTFKNRKKTGGFYWANSVVTPVRDERGEITNFLAVQEDVTEKMKNEERLNYLANFDGLTGLINRSRFNDGIAEWLLSARGKGLAGVLCLMNLDQFKLVNDTFGHGTGDEYLRSLSNLLNDAVRGAYGEIAANTGGKPYIGRAGGDEFAVFLPGPRPEKGIALMEKMRASVEALSFAETSSTLTVSAGAVLYPEHGLTVKDLLTRADAAMFRAKELGRNRVHLYRPEDQDIERMHSRLSWKEKVLKGLKEDRFVPWFQPLLDLKGNRIVHYEALARLVSEDGSVLLPGAFIEVAERFGIVGLIDRVIIEKTMRVSAEARNKGLDLSFGINLSGKDLGDADLLVFIKSKMAETGCDPARLIFEITETAAIGDMKNATRFVRSLKELGCKFSLDDFGVGFTSFTYLKELQVDYIKIDGSFIRKLHENPVDQVFVKAITDLAKGLRIKSIAEFVEYEKTLELLESFGVDYAQGYLIGKPAPELKPPGHVFDRRPGKAGLS